MQIETKEFNIKLFSKYIFTLSKGNGIYWFRIFGKGLHFKDTTKCEPTFSERYGFNKSILIGKWRIKYLK